MKKQFLITGGSGFIGKRLLETLHTQHDWCEVTAFVRPSTDTKRVPQGVCIVQGELEKMSTLESIFSQNSFHAVVHLAADMDFYPSDVRTVQNNFETMKNLLEAAYRGGVREFVFVSSTMVHLPQAGLTTETSPLGYISEFASRHSDFKFTILRPTGVYGPGEVSTFYQVIWGVNAGLFFFMVPNTGICQWTHVDDIVSGIVASISPEVKMTNSTYILCSDDTNATYYDVVCLVAQACNRQKPFVYLPFNFVRTAVKYGKYILNTVFFDKPFMYHEESIDELIANRRYSNAKAKADLKWTPKIRWKQGLEETTTWYYKSRTLPRFPLSPVFCILILLLVLLWM